MRFCSATVRWAFLISALFLTSTKIQAQSGGISPEPISHVPSTWFAVLELPFILLAILFSFLTARSLRGGRLGKGMGLLAWGFVVMGIGHVLLLTEQLWGINVLGNYFGPAGPFLWLAALATSWVLSWLGFYSMYKVSKGPEIERR